MEAGGVFQSGRHVQTTTATTPRQASKAKGGQQEAHRLRQGDRIKARYSSRTHTLAADGPSDALHNAEIVGQRQLGKYRIKYLDGDIRGDLATLPANQLYMGLSSDMSVYSVSRLIDLATWKWFRFCFC